MFFFYTSYSLDLFVGDKDAAANAEGFITNTNSIVHFVLSLGIFVDLKSKGITEILNLQSDDVGI